MSNFNASENGFLKRWQLWAVLFMKAKDPFEQFSFDELSKALEKSRKLFEWKSNQISVGSNFCSTFFFSALNKLDRVETVCSTAFCNNDAFCNNLRIL